MHTCKCIKVDGSVLGLMYWWSASFSKIEENHQYYYVGMDYWWVAWYGLMFYTTYKRAGFKSRNSTVQGMARTIVDDRAASGVAAHQNRLSTANRTRAMVKIWTQVMYPTDHAQF
jgi:hypothetical protein